MSNSIENIVLITVDALRYDLISEKFEDLELKNIRELRSEGYEFERAFSNGTATVSAFPAILYSSKINDGSTPNSASIAEVIREEGYQTVGLTSNPNTSSFYDYDRGFDIFEDYIEPPESKRQNPVFRVAKDLLSKLRPVYNLWRQYRSEHSLPYERAEKLNNDFYKLYEEDKKQFFWLHYMETHAPYSPPERYGNKYEPEFYSSRGKLTNKLYDEDLGERERKALWNLYKAEAKYLDDKIGELLEYIRAKSDSYLIVFTSDHGEEFGERGGFQHSKLFNFNLRVPLIFAGRGLENRSSENLASHLDIGPTILGLIGGKYGGFEGIDLFTEERDSLVIDLANRERYSVITQDWKLIQRENDAYLFDISQVLSEDDNLIEEKPEIAERLSDLNQKDSLGNIDW